MAYGKGKLSSNDCKTSHFSQHSEQEMHQTDFDLCNFTIALFKHFLISLTDFIDISSSVRILYSSSLLTES
jgi:hypothetical protein